MEEKTYTEKLYKKFKEILELLTKKDLCSVLDHEISDKETVAFNGYMTEEGLKHEILHELLPELTEILSDYEFYEPDEKKIATLKNNMTERILNPVLDPFAESAFERRFMQLDDDRKKTAMSFLDVQNNLRKEVSSKLNKNQNSEMPSMIKIKWLGNQKQLAELFARLILNGWIQKPEEGYDSAFANTLAHVFDLSETLKKADSNVGENLRQQLKPSYNAKGNLIYPNCVTGSGSFLDFPENSKKLKNK